MRQILNFGIISFIVFLVDGKDDLGVLPYCLSHIYNLELTQPLSNNQLSVPELMSRIFAPSVHKNMDICACSTSMFFFLSSVPLLPWPTGIWLEAVMLTVDVRFMSTSLSVDQME